MGRDDQFEADVEKLRRPLLRFFSLVHDRAVAEKLAEDTFLELYRKRNTWSATHSFAMMAYRIGADLAAQANLAPKRTCENSLPQAVRQSAIRDAVAKLPDRERIAVLLHKYQSLDYAQIGSVLSICESDAKALVQETYRSLRENLRELL